jgi:hypothetical protein
VRPVPRRPARALPRDVSRQGDGPGPAGGGGLLRPAASATRRPTASSAATSPTPTTRTARTTRSSSGRSCS